MKVIDSKLYQDFLNILEGKKFSQQQKELLASIASISPFAYRTLLKFDFQYILDTYNFFDIEGINVEIAKILEFEEAHFLKSLKLMKYRELLKIITRDVLFDQDILKTLEELSTLADLIIGAVYKYTTPRFIQKVKNPITIIGMGKLGSMELNFSSDIDIMYVHEGTDLEFEEDYNKWALKINRLLSHYNQDGFLYRVDNDIRPGGKYSPLSMSAQAVINFYLNYGETWQRVALLRARFLFGNYETFQNLFNDLEHYIYRRYIDFTMVQELRDLKQKINQESLAKDIEGKNIKLGKGGIRELEFFVQALQIMYGGRNKKIRVSPITDAIKALRNESLLSEIEEKRLIESYKFLRKVENAIQMEDEQQVYLLPSDKERLLFVAKRSGFDNLDSFLKKLDEVRNFVSNMFSNLFGEKSNHDDLKIVEKSEDLEKIIIEFKDHIAFSEDNLKEITKLFEKIPIKYRESYSVFLIEALKKLKKSGIAKDVLNRFVEFLKVLVRRPMYLPLLAENVSIIEMLINFFSAGPFLSRILINSPETLDLFLMKDDVNRNDWRQYLKSIQKILSGVDDFEIEMKILRQYKNSEWLKIGALYTNNEISIVELEQYLTNLAEAILISVINSCKKLVRERLEEPKQEVGIIGMGKLGSMEMNYFSDLDLIFLYRSLDDNAVYFNTKVLQKVIMALTTTTEEGNLYEVDMRLRPTGSQGPLVTSFQNFCEYHLKSSWIFEKQALTRARVLDDNSQFKIDVENFIKDLLYKTAFEDKYLKQEILKMRTKIEDELAIKEKKNSILEIKYGQGGITDIEFIIQYLKLRYGSLYKELQTPVTSMIFSSLESLDIIDINTIRVLRKHYEFLKKVDMALRLMLGYSKHSLNEKSEIISNVAIFCGYDEKRKNRFLHDLKNIKKEVRKIFLKILNG